MGFPDCGLSFLAKSEEYCHEHISGNTESTKMGSPHFGNAKYRNKIILEFYL